MKRKYLVILSLILCISLGLSSVSAAIVATDDSIVNDEISSDAIQADVNGVSDEINKVSVAKADPVETYILADPIQCVAGEKATVTAEVYFKYNDVPTLVKNGTVTLKVDGKAVQTVDLANCNGSAEFNIPALAEGTPCILVYSGGFMQDEEISCELAPSSTDIVIVPQEDPAIPTTIKVSPSKITGTEGSMAKVSAKVVFTFNDVESIADVGTLSLLKDGKVIQTVDLSKNSNPTFSFKLEKGHKYSLSYSGGNTGGELDLKLGSSSTGLDVTVLDKKIDMENTGAPLAVLLVALLGLPLYLRRK